MGDSSVTASPSTVAVTVDFSSTFSLLFRLRLAMVDVNVNTILHRMDFSLERKLVGSDYAIYKRSVGESPSPIFLPFTVLLL